MRTGGFIYKNMKWILASQSPRRKELLGELIEQFDIIPAKGEEKLLEGATVCEQVQALAKAKAEEIAMQPLAENKWVLGADTVVVLGNEILGKPKDEQDAERMLTALSGNTHEVWTGVCMMKKSGEEITAYIASDCTKVVFETLDKAQIASYIASGSPMDKAGAYGIQDGGLVKEIKGSFSNVVGLPVELCKRMIEQINKEN